jgi:MFS family permease
VPSSERDRVFLAVMVFVVLFAQVLLYPGITDLVAALGATTDLDASTWFLAAEFAGFVLCAGLWGALSDTTGQRVPFITASALLGAAGYAALVVLGRAGSVAFETVILLRFLQGCATICAFSLSITMLMDLGGGHGRNMGAAGIAIGLGTALGAPIGGQLTGIGPLVPLMVASGLLVLAALLATRVPDRVPESRRGGLRRAVSGLRDRPALSLPYAFGFMDRLTAGFFALVGTIYFRKAFSLDAAGAGILLGLFFAPFGLLQYPLGVLSDRIGRLLPVVGGSVCYGGMIIAVYLAPTVVVAGALMVILGVFAALVAPTTMALVTDLADDAERGVAMGGFNIFGSLGFLAGVVVGGTVASTFGFGAAFFVVGILEAGIVLVTLPALLRLDLPPTATFRSE